MVSNGKVSDSLINRRDILGALSATMAMGLAGCGDSEEADWGSDDELGERVPTLTMQYYSGWYSMERISDAASQQLPNRIGVEIDPNAADIATAVADVSQDSRTTALPLYAISATPEGSYGLERFSIEEAGSAGTNNAQWANCEYSVLVNEHRKITDEERRDEVLNEAQRIRSNDLAIINSGTGFLMDWASRPDQVEFDSGRVGETGFWRTNIELLTSLESAGDTQRISIATEQDYLYDTSLFWNSASMDGPWNNLVHSKLLYHDPENNFGQEDLAESIEISDDGLEYTVTITDDATFHNGDPVTAEDVKFTFEWLTENPGLFQQAPRLDLSVEAVDETTAIFELEEQYAPLINRDFHTFGILHRDTWIDAGAHDDPSSARPGADMVGSGPYEVVDFDSGSSLILEPFEDHHQFDPSVPITMEVYTDSEAIFSALQAGDLSVGPITPPHRQQIADMDDLEVVSTTQGSPYIIMPQYSFAPTKFFEFREAVAMALNYQEIEALTTLGEVEPDIHASTLSRASPRRAPDEMLYEQGNGNPEGDPEAARQVLRDAGWNWDSDNNLHYPPDADLSPRWPEEGVPDPDDYPCLNDEGEYVRPDDIDLPVDI